MYKDTTFDKIEYRYNYQCSGLSKIILNQLKDKKNQGIDVKIKDNLLRCNMH